MNKDNMNTYFVFSDVHGEYNALMESLMASGYDRYNPKHILVSLGDNFDRGPDSYRIYRFFKESVGQTICIKGNHDVMFEEYLEKGLKGTSVLFNILHNGLDETISSFSSIPVKDFNMDILDKDIRKRIPRKISLFLQTMPLYFETKSFIFCHAGIDPDILSWENTSKDFMLWDIEKSHRSCRNTHKTVVIGHHHALRVREQLKKRNVGFDDVEVNGARYTIYDDKGTPIDYDTFQVYGNTDNNRPVKNGNKICIDGCTNLTGKVNILVIKDFPKDYKEEKEETENSSSENKNENISQVQFQTSVVGHGGYINLNDYNNLVYHTMDGNPVTVTYTGN